MVVVFRYLPEGQNILVPDYMCGDDCGEGSEQLSRHSQFQEDEIICMHIGANHKLRANTILF
jgi:hypothetical protein